MESYQVSLVKSILASIRSLGQSAKGYPCSDYQSGYLAALQAVIDLIEQGVTTYPLLTLSNPHDLGPDGGSRGPVTEWLFSNRNFRNL